MNRKQYGLILLFFVLPALIWAGLFFTRPYLYSLSCAQEPTPCVISNINPLDQAAFLVRSIRGDFYSNVIQNTIGTIAFLLPFLLYTFRRRRNEVALDFGSFLSATIWNGAIIEIARYLVQRPRPMVYDSPLIEGANSLQYTSFYSGHTSFVALATLNILFMVKRKEDFSSKWVLAAFTSYVFWTGLTGFLRVYGGRHYPTDVIFGAFAGTVIALVINKLSLKRFQIL